MEILSVNIGRKTEVEWSGEKVATGIYKDPVEGAVQIFRTGVDGSFVGNREVHGGEDKAVYAYSYDHYPEWQSVYPDLPWQMGMFGENLTVKGCNENVIYVGDVYQMGTARVQACQPRHPCYKFGIRFGTQESLKQFIDFGWPGVYFKVVEEGKVQKGDKLVLKETGDENLSIGLLFKMAYQNFNDPKLLERVLENPVIPDGMKEKVRKAQLRSAI